MSTTHVGRQIDPFRLENDRGEVCELHAPNVDHFASESYQTTKTKKVMKNHVKAEATKEHPAQVETYTEDVIVGYWTTVKFSSAIPAKEKNEMLERVRKLQEAVKCAREEANGMEVESRKIGAAVLNHVFGKHDLRAGSKLRLSANQIVDDSAGSNPAIRQFP